MCGIEPDKNADAGSGENRRPHRVYCRIELAGSMEGQIANRESLRAWLLQRGHVILSDSDGEILAHLVEDHYSTDSNLSSSDLAGMRQAYACSKQSACMPDRVLRMVDSIRKTDAIIEGAYAAFIVEPRLPGVFAIKSGHELFDASILAKVPSLTPMADGEGIWLTETSRVRFMLRGFPVFPGQGL